MIDGIPPIFNQKPSVSPVTDERVSRLKDAQIIGGLIDFNTGGSMKTPSLSKPDRHCSLRV